MSRKKKYTTVGLPEEIFERLKQEAIREQRTKSFIVERSLREHYSLPWGETKTEEYRHAD